MTADNNTHTHEQALLQASALLTYWKARAEVAEAAIGQLAPCAPKAHVPAHPDYTSEVRYAPSALDPELQAALTRAFNAAYPLFLEALSIGADAPKPPAKQAGQVVENVPAKHGTEQAEPLPKVDPWAAQVWSLYGEAQRAAVRLNATAFALEHNQCNSNINRVCTVRTDLGAALNALGVALPEGSGWLHTRLNLLHTYLQEITNTTRFAREALANNNGVSAKEYSCTIGATAHNICRLLEDCNQEMGKVAPLAAR